MNQPPDQTYSWQVRLSARDPQKLYSILFMCVLGAFAGWLLFHNVAFALIGFVAIGASTAEYWLPQKYKLDRNGASAQCGISVSAIQWSDVKQVLPDERRMAIPSSHRRATTSHTSQPGERSPVIRFSRRAARRAPSR